MSSTCARPATTSSGCPRGPAKMDVAPPQVDDSFILESHAHGSDMMIGVNSLRLQGYFVDVVLCVQDSEFPCHRNILATSSPYFRAMFCSDLREAHDFRVSFNEISPETMNRILNYVYLGTITIDRDNVEDTLAAASLFQFSEIVSASSDFLKEQLDVANCLGIEAFAALHGCAQLQQLSSKVVQDNFKEVAMQDEFLCLDVEKLVNYISSDQIDIDSERDVFDVALRWVKHDLERRKRLLPVLMGHVRFQTMDASTLKSVVLEEALVISCPKSRAFADDAFEFLTRRDGTRVPPCHQLPAPSFAVVRDPSTAPQDATHDGKTNPSDLELSGGGCDDAVELRLESRPMSEDEDERVGDSASGYSRVENSCDQSSQSEKDVRRLGRTKVQSPRPSTIAKECLILLGGNRFSKSEEEAVGNQGPFANPQNQFAHASFTFAPALQPPTTPPLSPPNPATSLIMYCPLRDKWIPLPDLPCKLKYYSMAVLNNDIYISGGIQQSFGDAFSPTGSSAAGGGNVGSVNGANQTIVASVWRFTTRTREWSPLSSPMSRPRAKHASCGFKGKLFVFGGISPTDDAEATDTASGNRLATLLNEDIECYDFSTCCWTVVCTTPFPRKHSVVVPFKDKIFEIGGTTYETRGSISSIGAASNVRGAVGVAHAAVATTSSLTRSNMIESFAFSPTDGKLVYSGEHFVLPSHVHFAQVIVLDEVFYIISEDSRTCLAFSPLKRSIRRLAHLQHSHFNSGATGLGGKIYVVGGLVNGFVSNVVEMYDPAKDSWEIGKPLPFCLSGHGCVSVLM